MISGDNYEIRSKDILHKLNWKPLNHRRLEQLLVLVYKILKQETMIDQFQISQKSKV